jgi:hypothetical protein
MADRYDVLGLKCVDLHDRRGNRCAGGGDGTHTAGMEVRFFEQAAIPFGYLSTTKEQSD